MSRLGKAGEEATSEALIRPAGEPAMDNESERMDDAPVESETPRQIGSERWALRLAERWFPFSNWEPGS